MPRTVSRWRGWFGIGLELLPQAPHGDPHVGRLGVVRLRPAADHQRVRRDRLAEVGGEGEEETRLGRGQLDGLAADDRLTPVELEDEIRAEVEALARHPLADPPQDPLDPRSQLRVVVGLGDVVLGELVEEVGLVVAGIDRRQHDDRQVRPGLDLACERQPVHARHQQVDDQQVRPAVVEPPQGLLAVTRGRRRRSRPAGAARRGGRAVPGRRPRAGSVAPRAGGCPTPSQ